MDSDTTYRTVDLALGQGGRSPGVMCCAKGEQGRPEEVFVSLPASAYAIDLDPCEQRLACGMRSGMIHVIPFDQGFDSQQSQATTQLLHGRPILAVCFAAEGGLVSADDSGQVLRWQGDKAASPTQWMADGPAICAFSAQTEGVVVGLGIDGQVFLWDTECGKAIQRFSGPPPIPPFGIVRLTNWVLDGHVVMAYPVRDGRLAMIDINAPAVHAQPGHEGCWYAAFQLGDQLITIGHYDGIARVWHWTDEGAVCKTELPAFPAATGADMADDRLPASGVAILAHGSAVRFTITSESLQIDSMLPGEDYRVMASPCERLARRHSRGREEQRAAQLRDRITASIQCGEDTCLDESLDELERLGRQRDSLDIRVQHAGSTGNRIAELQALHQRVNGYDEDAPARMTPLIDRYIELLCEYGQIELAVEVFERMSGRLPGISQAAVIDGLRAAVLALREGRAVVRMQGDGMQHMKEASQAESILERPLMGLWELHRSNGLLLPGARFGPEQLADELQAGAVTSVTAAPRPVVQTMLWCHGAAIEELGMVVLRAVSERQAAPFLIALPISDLPAGTQVKRSILLDFGDAGKGGRTQRNGEFLIAAASELSDAANRRFLLAATDSWVLTTLRRIRGAALASALNDLGDIE